MPQLMVRVTTKKLREKLLKCENEVDNSIYSNVLKSKKELELRSGESRSLAFIPLTGVHH